MRVGADPPAYLLAATVFTSETGLERLERVKPKSAAKLHWREMTDAPKRASLEAIAGIEQATVLVAAAPLPRRKQERARRKCLEALLPELEARGVGKLVLEARDESKNGKDIELLMSLRRKGGVKVIDVVHMRADDEPRLWLPDQVLGAYGDVLCGSRGCDKWRDAWFGISRQVEVVNVAV